MLKGNLRVKLGRVTSGVKITASGFNYKQNIYGALLVRKY